MMGWHWGWDGGWGVFGMAHMFLWWILIILGIVVLARLAFGQRRGNSPDDRAHAILRERYARGEITKDQFDALKRDLSQ